MRLRHVIGAFTLALMATSCSLGDSDDAGSITVDLDINPGTLPIDETMTISVLARNVGSTPLTLSGPGDCLLYIEVLDTQGQIVWQSNSAGACTGAIVTEEIAPGASKVQTFTWNGTSLAGARLPSGFYFIRGIARLTPSSYIGPVARVSLE